MHSIEFTYTLINSTETLKKFKDQHKDVDWIAIDTEFISEKRYEPLLCLIQIASVHGLYLIDTIEFEEIHPFFELIENPKILKITHSGENDYRLFFQKFDITPKNIFDTQIAAGLVSTDYPISFQRLLERELKVQIPKGQTVTNWDARPLSKKQIQYALADVHYLPALWDKLSAQIAQFQREDWAQEEFSIWESRAFFATDSYSRAINNPVIRSLSFRRKVFFIRLYKWRQEEAEKQNLPRETILPEKTLVLLAQFVNKQRRSITNHRRISSRFIQNYWDTLKTLFEQEASPEEKEMIDNIPRDPIISERYHLTLELVYWLIKYRCQELHLAPPLLLRGNALRKLKRSPDFLEDTFNKGWRKDLVGPTLISWLKDPEKLQVNWNDNKLEIGRNMSHPENPG